MRSFGCFGLRAQRTVLTVLISVSVACAAGAPPIAAEAPRAGLAPIGAPMPAATPPAPPSPKAAAANDAAPRGAELAKSAERPKKPNVMILYTGFVDLKVPEGGRTVAIDEAVTIAERFGGYLGGRTNGAVKVKIPSGSFREALTEIEKLGEVTREDITADDVTAEFHDLEVRLENLRATRKRVEEFLAKAATLADMLTVQRELERIAAEIDTISGRLRFLREHTAFSTLTLNVTEIPKVVPVVAKNPPPPPLPPPPPPARALELPVAWFARLGIGPLLAMPPKP